MTPARPTLEQAKQVARGSWPTEWDIDPADCLIVLAEALRTSEADLLAARSKLALAAEDAAGDQERWNDARRVLIHLVAANKDFEKSTDLHIDDAIGDAIKEAYEVLEKYGCAMEHNKPENIG